MVCPFLLWLYGSGNIGRNLEGHPERSTLAQRTFEFNRYKVWNEAKILRIENNLYIINVRKRSACLNSPISQPSLEITPVVSSDL
jgi:hypothetical protein